MAKRLAGSKLIRWAIFVAISIVAIGAWLTVDPGFGIDGHEPVAKDMPRDSFERRIRAYLLENPEVIIEAMSGLEARQRVAARTEVQSVLIARADELLRDPESPVGGNPDGDVSVVEFFDYNCPYCRQMTPVMSALEATDAQVRVVYKEFPILGPDSVFAAKAALASYRQDRYVAFHQALMQSKGNANEAAVFAVAAQVGLDIERLKSDMQDLAIVAAIERNLGLAKALRITGTPSFVFRDEVVRGATDLTALQTKIAKVRAAQ